LHGEDGILNQNPIIEIASYDCEYDSPLNDKIKNITCRVNPPFKWRLKLFRVLLAGEHLFCLHPGCRLWLLPGPTDKSEVCMKSIARFLEYDIAMDIQAKSVFSEIGAPLG
jgi:hypothetical protein